MSQFNIFRAIYLSFYSKELYQDVGKRWNGKAFLYLLILLMLSWIIAVYQLQVNIKESYYQAAAKMLPQIPTLTIKDGKISTPENRPYFIKEPDGKWNAIVIDTTGQYTTLEQTQSVVLITQTDIIAKSRDQTRIMKASNVFGDNGVVDPQWINSFVVKIIDYLWIFYYVMLVLASYIYRVVQALVYAILGKILCAALGAHLSYSQVLRVAMVAVTPAIILATVLDALYIVFPFQMFFYFILTMFYLFYGIQANNE